MFWESSKRVLFGYSTNGVIMFRSSSSFASERLHSASELYFQLVESFYEPKPNALERRVLFLSNSTHHFRSSKLVNIRFDAIDLHLIAFCVVDALVNKICIDISRSSISNLKLLEEG